MSAAKELLSSSLLGTTTSCLLPSKTKWSPVLGSCLTPVVVVVVHDNKRKNKRSHVGIHSSANEKVVPKVADDVPAKVKVRAAVTVRWNKRTKLMEKIANHVDAVADMVGRNVVMELISTDVDPMTRRPKRSGEAVMKGWLEKMLEVNKKQRVVYSVEFTVDSSFGTAGAVTVKNWHRREFFVETIVVEGFPVGLVRFNCYSWVQLSKDCQDKRVFFADKPYLPSETPEGLRELREKELEAARGDGTGERRASDRIYDYATYNDLGNPDKGGDWKRPTLGGEDIPYPRRLRTGRPSTFSEPGAESRVEKPERVYVPRDETFEEGKEEMLDDGELKAKLHLFIPGLVASSEECHDFQDFHEVDSLYKFHVQVKVWLHNHVLGKFVPFRSKLQEIVALLRFDDPSIITTDKFSWFRDEEFARQTVAGINPSRIERLRVFPPVSKFNRGVYGPLESALKEEHIIGHLDGMSVQQALEEKKLFILDYHDIYLPFLDRINSQPGRKAYATRALFYLTQLGTLTPMAIELTLPPKTPPTRAKRVLTPPVDGTTNWAWQLAKAHVCANDAGVHQLVNHWLRTHAAMEPFILAANRQLSRMHPVYKLLRPHMRYTLDINGFARQILISAGGVIESFYTSNSVSMEISSKAYLDSYRFDLEGLPQDLIRRGVAEPDPTDPHGLRLLIPDYPYAADGLLLHSAISKFIKTFISTTYPNAGLITSDVELQNWYAESVNAGHADLRDAAWWPRLDSPESLVSVLTTVVWLCSAQHAALNFGQYPVGGYIPNRPPLVRRLVPDERDPEYQWFLKDPEKFFLSAMPSLLQAAKFMTVIDTLSTHSKDEEYLGQSSKETFSWAPEIAKAFEEFTADIKSAEEEIARRNKDTSLRNRCGSGILPYELLMSSSNPGITGRGVPNSVTI